MIWQDYFMNMCEAVAVKSSCLTRKIGVIIVRDNTILSTGYNGPPRGMKHCDERFRLTSINDPLTTVAQDVERAVLAGKTGMCPRRALDYQSGEALYLCPAVHAEINALTNAARAGVSVADGDLYINTVCPCKDCLGAIINAGIKRIFHQNGGYYDYTTSWIANLTKIELIHYGKSTQMSEM